MAIQIAAEGAVELLVQLRAIDPQLRRTLMLEETRERNVVEVSQPGSVESFGWLNVLTGEFVNLEERQQAEIEAAERRVWDANP